MLRSNNKIYTNNWDSSYQKSSEDESNDSHDVQTDNTRHYDDCLRKGIASHQAKYIGNASAQVTSFNGAVYSSVSSSVSSVSSLFHPSSLLMTMKTTSFRERSTI